ncbi:MAG: COQ9 family protein [Pseudomonadota bacterium]
MADPATRNMPLAPEEVTLIEAALPHVAFDGWSNQSLRAACEDTGIDLHEAKMMFPRGGADLALAFHKLGDERLSEALAAGDLSTMRIRDRITHCVRKRIEVIGTEREAVRRSASLLALPMYAPEGARAMWRTADLIWDACGDTSGDYNWYTKRAILSGVMSATVLYWLGDQDPDLHPTWAFLDRRIEGVMQFEKTKAQLQNNPVARAAFAIPAGLLGMIRAPGARP